MVLRQLVYNLKFWFPWPHLAEFSKRIKFKIIKDQKIVFRIFKFYFKIFIIIIYYVYLFLFLFYFWSVFSHRSSTKGLPDLTKVEEDTSASNDSVNSLRNLNQTGTK